MATLSVLTAAQSPTVQNLPPQSSVDASKPAPAGAVSALIGMLPEGSDDTSADLPQIPALLGGPGISSAFISELERSNYLRGGVNVGAVYDSNPLLLSSGTESNTSESIFPNIRIEESSSRLRWTLGYAGGLTINQKITSQNQGSHNLNFDSQYRLSPHVNLRVAENFSMTTGFFDAGNATEVIAGSVGPNASLIAPLATQRSSLTTVEANYHYALNDLIGASGSFYDLHFTNVPADTQLTNSQTASGSAFWLHRFIGKDWGGVSYRFDRITFNPGNGESRVHSFLAMNTLSFSNHFTLTGFIGPQYSENEGLAPGGAPAPNAWSVAGGADLGWANQRTSVSVGYSRTISDGAGISGSVRLQSIYGAFRRELVPGWAVALTASHGTNQSLVVPTASDASSINLTSASISLERNVGKSIGFRLGYAHDFQEQVFQQQGGLPAPNPTASANRNRFFVTLSYQWAKPIGM
ncbi:MAG: hypothetical protein WB566_13935 [Terriglobales bacterium]